MQGTRNSALYFVVSESWPMHYPGAWAFLRLLFLIHIMTQSHAQKTTMRHAFDNIKGDAISYHETKSGRCRENSRSSEV